MASSVASLPKPTKRARSRARYRGIHAPADSCPQCPFRGPRVGSKGNPEAPLVFVAESPGVIEVRDGIPLIGPTGRVFHQFAPDDDSVYILNALECNPPKWGKKKQSIMNQATHSCNARLIQKIAAHPHRLIVGMGNPAIRSLTGDHTLKITQIRGRLIPSYLSELGIFPIVHIAALMRGTGSFRQWREDMQYIMELAKGGSPRPHLKAEVQVIPPFVPQSYIDQLFEMMLHEDPNRELTCDIETTGLSHIHHRILSLGVTPSTDKSISFCFYPWHFDRIRRYLEDPTISWAWHGGKFDIKFLRAAGIKARVDDDTMLQSYALDELGGVHSLETVSADVLSAPDYKYMIQPYLPRKDSSYELVPKPVLAAYQAIDTSNTAQIRPILRERIRRDPALEKLYTRTLLPASEMLTWVEENGICTDPQRLIDNEAFFIDMKADISQQIYDMIGYEINPGSPKQVSELFFRRMKRPNRRKGSTDAKVIDWLQQKYPHPIYNLILKHREAVKMHGTYVKGLLIRVNPLTNRIHATFLIHGTRTGRLAARDPNLQNPPRMPQIRGTFVAADGYELVEVDLSQAEMRSLATLSKCPVLSDVFLTGRSPHKDLSIYFSDNGIYEPNWEERYVEYSADPGNPDLQLAYEEYTKTKNVNFGIMYGITNYGLQGQIGGTLQHAQILLDGWYERYPGAKEFINKCREAPRNGQDITTMFGRRKRHGIVSAQNLSFLMNEAANFPHQSISSDITLHAGLRTWKELRAMGVRLVNLIHDSLLMEVPITPDNHIRHKTVALVKGTMEQVPIDWGLTHVPFEAEAEVGHRWGSLTEYKEAA